MMEMENDEEIRQEFCDNLKECTEKLTALLKKVQKIIDESSDVCEKERLTSRFNQIADTTVLISNVEVKSLTEPRVHLVCSNKES